MRWLGLGHASGTPPRAAAVCHPEQISPNYVTIGLTAIGRGSRLLDTEQGYCEGATRPCTQYSHTEPLISPDVYTPPRPHLGESESRHLSPLLLTLGFAPVNSILESSVCEIKFLSPKVRAPPPL